MAALRPGEGEGEAKGSGGGGIKSRSRRAPRGGIEAKWNWCVVWVCYGQRLTVEKLREGAMLAGARPICSASGVALLTTCSASPWTRIRGAPRTGGRPLQLGSKL